MVLPKILLDSSVAFLDEAETRWPGIEFGQLITPLTRRKQQRSLHALDNGCYRKFEKESWLRQLDEARESDPIFVTLPDVVGSAVRTGELFRRFSGVTDGLPRALVLQDGIGGESIYWEDIEAVFIGGTDAFKNSHEAIAAATAAKMLGKWVHVGRVNSASRAKQWADLADSYDGSGISRYTAQLDVVCSALMGMDDQGDMFSGR